MNIDYFNLLFLKDIETILTEYHPFESKLIDDILFQSFEYFRKCKAIIRGNIFNLDNIDYSLTTGSGDSPRVLRVSIIRLDRVRGNYNKRRSINEIGKISEIEIYYPRGFGKHADELIEFLLKRIKYAYASLETAALSKYKEYEHSIIKNLYEMIEIELRKNNYPQLVNHFWLTITQVTSSDDSDMALFFFNERVLKSVFEILKNNQNIIYSPFELAAAFIVEKVPDEGMAYFREEKYDVVLEFSKMYKSNSNYYKYWLAEKSLFGGKSFGFKYICLEKDWLLAVNYSKENMTIINKTVESIEVELINIFRTNRNNRKLKFDLFEKKRIEWNKIYIEGKDIITSIIAKISTDLIKTI